MRSLSIAFCIFVVFLSVNMAQATIIHVPAEQPTIGAGLDHSTNSGDTVLVAPGIYNESVFITGWGKVLASEFILTGDTNTIYNTIIQGSILINNVQDTNLTISGFTITNPSTANNLPGIYGYRCYPLICHNRIIGNNSSSGSYYGGGIDISEPTGPYGSRVRIISNTISSNIGKLGGGIAVPPAGDGFFILIKDNLIAGNQGGMGGGIYSSYGFITIEENLILGNVAVNGGAVCCSLSRGVLMNNTISDNAGAFAGGIYCNVNYLSTITIKNNIISHSIDGAGVFYKTPSKGEANDKLLIISYNDCWGNADGNYGGSCPDPTGLNGNISSDPLFCNWQNGNYLLNNTSPCVGSGEGGINIGAFGVGCGMNYGVHVYSGEDTSGFVNSQVNVTFYVQNTGQLSDTYNLVISDSLGWQVNPTYSQMTLNSGQRDSILVTVNIPSTSIYTKNKVRLTATSQTEPLATDSGWLMISVIPVLGDANCDGVVDVGDVIYTINYLFKGGPPPCD